MIESVIRRRRLADAAIDTLAAGGPRGLTHRAVDHAAGLPEGSCSYYFRTRQALLLAVVDRVVEVEAADLDLRLRVDDAAGPIEVAAMLVRLIQHRVGSARSRTLARFELVLETARSPKLHRQLHEVDLRLQTSLAAMLTGLGTTDPRRQAVLLSSYLDGLVLHLITSSGSGRLTRTKLHATLQVLIRSFTTG